MNKRITTINLDEKILLRLRAKARREDRSVSAIINETLRKAFPKPKIKKKKVS